MGETLVKFTTRRSTTTAVTASSEKKPRIESNHLFEGNSEVVIVHQNQEYNLRITRNGKLILTK